MPPLDPPEACAPHLEQRSDDNEETIRKRLEVRRLWWSYDMCCGIENSTLKQYGKTLFFKKIDYCTIKEIGTECAPLGYM